MTGRAAPRTIVLAAVLIFMAAPILIVIVNSFNSTSYGQWPPPSLSLRWYGNLLRQQDFADAAVRSVLVAAGATALTLIAGTMGAVALVRLRLPGSAAINGFLLSPMIVPHVALGLAGFTLFLRLHIYGTLPSLIFAHAVLLLPFVVTIVGAGLVRLDPSIEEAALDLGASRLRAFWSVVVPQFRASLIIAAVLGLVVSFDELDASIFLVSPQNQTLPVAMYTYMQKYQDPTLSALSTVLIAATLILASILLRFFGPAGLAQAVAASDRRALD
jgi:ABC-type spermidine/putrescine transport system permease subunit II